MRMQSPDVAPSHATPVGTEPPQHGSFALLCLGALGVVYGDIGTSPLYTLKECLLVTQESGPVVREDVFGVVSLIFWALTLVVTVKYLVFIMRADNRGEGGIFALLALVPEPLRSRGSQASWIAVLAVVGAALLYGDGAITPAISVLSAVEGLKIARPGLEEYVVPLTVVILIGLFAMQRFGTAAVGKLFGPVMVVWFTTLAVLGIVHIARYPDILAAVSPHHAVSYFTRHGWHGYLILGSVVLAITGGEALYADLGHFGIRPIRMAWTFFVMPALMLAYFGQGALVLQHPDAAENPFFAMVPAGNWTVVLVVLSSMATVIASQALISGAFSLTRQAMQLGYFPRVTVRHTARDAEGQIFIPQINTLLMVGCITLVLVFRSSTRLAAAYGIAVTGTMAITSMLYYVVARSTWGWSVAKALPLLVLFLAIDLAFFGANLFKFADGGYVPVLIAAAFIASMLLWSRGRSLIVKRYLERFPSLDEAYARLEQRLVARVPGTAIFLASSVQLMPPALMHHVERNRVLHENVLLLTVRTLDVPHAAEDERLTITSLPLGFHRVVACCGFMEHPNVPAFVLASCEKLAVPLEPENVTYYLGREAVQASSAGAMGRLAERIFSFLQRNTESADRHFGIPPGQIVELGSQVDL